MTQIQIDQARRSYLDEIFGHFIRGCSSAVAELRIRRRIGNSLGSLSSRDLRDIGLIESDVDAVKSTPLSQDATTALKCKVLFRSANW